MSLSPPAPKRRMSRTQSWTERTRSCYTQRRRAEAIHSKPSKRWPASPSTPKNIWARRLSGAAPRTSRKTKIPTSRGPSLSQRGAPRKELDARYIVAFTESGSTVRLVSHSRPKSHILGFTPSDRVFRRLAMRWGVTPMRGEHFDTTDAMLEVAMKFLKRRGFVDTGDVVVTVCGHTTLPGATNMMKVYKF